MNVKNYSNCRNAQIDQEQLSIEGGDKLCSMKTSKVIRLGTFKAYFIIIYS